MRAWRPPFARATASTRVTDDYGCSFPDMSSGGVGGVGLRSGSNQDYSFAPQSSSSSSSSSLMGGSMDPRARILESSAPEYSVYGNQEVGSDLSAPLQAMNSRSYPNISHYSTGINLSTGQPCRPSFISTSSSPSGTHTLSSPAGAMSSSVYTKAALGLPDIEEGKVYVNSKQYNRIIKRRKEREEYYNLRKIITKFKVAEKKPYMHESRHRHAVKRPRGAGGRFLPKQGPEGERRTLSSFPREGTDKSPLDSSGFRDIKQSDGTIQYVPASRSDGSMAYLHNSQVL